MTIDKISDDVSIQERYEQLVATGTAPKFAEMLALQQPPGAKGCDRHFWEGRLLNNGLLGKGAATDFVNDETRKKAKAAGIDTNGKIYVGGLADGRGPSDPMAWVSDISDIRHVAKERNLDVTGVTEFRGEDRGPVNETPIAPDILQRLMDAELRRDPSWAKDLTGLRQFVIDRHQPDYSVEW